MKQMAVFITSAVYRIPDVLITHEKQMPYRGLSVFWNSQKICVNTHFHLQSKVAFKTINTLNGENKSSFLHDDETYKDTVFSA